MKVAVYSANFGNYRNEMSNPNVLNNIKFSNEIDYHFFTDMDLNDCKWNLHRIDLKESKEFMNCYRNTSKYIKFILPHILHKYDYVIWCDTKSLDFINSLDINKMQNLISKTNKKLYLIKHPCRKTPQEELEITIDWELEKKENAMKFYEQIKGMKFVSKLPDSTCILRKTDKDTNNVFMEVYNCLLINKLCRDQNVIQFVLDNMKYETEIFYFDSYDDLYDKIQ